MAENQSRTDIAIEKLTVLGSNLDKLIGIQDERIKQISDKTESLDHAIERRREIFDSTVSSIYEDMRRDDKNIMVELNTFRKDISDVKKTLEDKVKSLEDKVTTDFKTINEKISSVDKTLWIFSGGLSIIVFLLTYGQNIIKILAAAGK